MHDSDYGSDDEGNERSDSVRAPAKKKARTTKAKAPSCVPPVPARQLRTRQTTSQKKAASSANHAKSAKKGKLVKEHPGTRLLSGGPRGTK